MIDPDPREPYRIDHAAFNDAEIFAERSGGEELATGKRLGERRRHFGVIENFTRGERTIANRPGNRGQQPTTRRPPALLAQVRAKSADFLEERTEQDQQFTIGKLESVRSIRAAARLALEESRPAHRRWRWRCHWLNGSCSGSGAGGASAMRTRALGVMPSSTAARSMLACRRLAAESAGFNIRP